MNAGPLPCHVLVVDDEPLARRRLLRLLAPLPEIGRISEAGDVDGARAILEGGSVEILILDIQLPGGNGFDLLEAIPEPAPALIFVTAFDHYALRAFAAAAVDYVTKPVQAGRFLAALSRAREVVQARRQGEQLQELQGLVHTLRRQLQAQQAPDRAFWVKTREDYLRIDPEQVLCFLAERDYVRLRLSTPAGEPPREYLHPESLASLERRLPESEFLRIHRSTLVRRNAILRLRPAPFGALIAVLQDGSEWRVGRTYTAGVRRALLAPPQG